MPGFILHANAVVGCSHPPGIATPAAVNSNVLVVGQFVATQPIPWTVKGCSQAAVPAPVCASGVWQTAAKRVFVNGQPVVLVDSQAKCIPTGTPLVVVGSQTRVFAQ